MLGVDFKGRLGNQMFTYAFARRLIEVYGEQEMKANFKRCGDGEQMSWGDSLRHFNVWPYTTVAYDLPLNHGTLTQRFLYLMYMACCKMPFVRRNDALLSRMERKLRQYGFHFTGAADAGYIPENVSGNVFVRGYFQDRRFFDDIRPILLREFTPKLPPIDHNSQLYRAIAQPNSVCVSVRRGDYLSEEYKKDFYVCTPDYYQKAIDMICQQVSDPVFIFFSDDIQWVRNHMSVPGFPCFYERGDDPVWETLRLMSSCHHFIISNSTFAWWAQYLGDRKDKMVICPSRWFANPEWHSNLINDHFLFV
ncbi:MAG: alpha-1,2-fucosyltransferase [Bacteroidaceae bacterium]|nr:alpha-1,2-fucosyltransferase [Bacteroidaceae bacterium]